MSSRIQEKIKSGYPVSYAQRRMWFLSRLESSSLLNNSSIKARLEGNLNIADLEKAFQMVVYRHEGFRTNFFQVDNGEVIQVINKYKKIKINFHDLSRLSLKHKQLAVKEIEKNNTHYKFDLSNDQLIRASLVRLEKNKYVFFMTLHHIVSDAWTLASFWNELSSAYESYVAKKKLSLPVLPIQYKDYAVWEQSSDYLKEFSHQKKFWKERLDGAPAFLPLPVDYPRPAVQTYHHKTIVSHLDRNWVNKIESICTELNITNYTFLLSCLAIFLYQVNNVSDMVIGTYVANRDQAELERVAGTLLNNLALRIKPNTKKSIKKFILENNQIVLAAMSNKEYPFEKLIEDLKIERNASHAPLFNVVFQVFTHDINFLEKTFTGFKKKIDIFNTDFFQHDLTFRVGISEKKFGFDLSYNKDLFSAETAQKLASCYQKTIEECVRKIGKNIEDIRGISEKEKKILQSKTRKSLVVNENVLNKIDLNSEQEKIEEKIICIWREVLKVDSINRNDDFFRLGGHSLKLIQVFDQIDKAFPGKITIALLFKYYTVASLAEYLSRDSVKGIEVRKITPRQEINKILDEVKKGAISIETAVDRYWDV